LEMHQPRALRHVLVCLALVQGPWGVWEGILDASRLVSALIMKT
jgi:hypothetical protein